MKAKSLVAFLSLTLCCASPVRAQTLDWIRQLGTSERDNGECVSADGLGNVYISGETVGSLWGDAAGGGDAFLSKYDASGAQLWTRQFGGSEADRPYGVSADGEGNVYVAGHTHSNDAWVNGWDVFISKYDASGAHHWTRYLGTSSDDQCYGVSADRLGNVYISGWTQGSLGGTCAGGRDAFISKYDASGTNEWTQQLGTSGHDYSTGVSADGLGNVYITGYTEGSLGGTYAGGMFDVFISKYHADGTPEWTRQLGTGGRDLGYGVSADGLGSVYISGVTSGRLGDTSAGGSDAFVSKYDASGTNEWTQQLGTSSSDYSYGVSADGLGNVYISGETVGNLWGINAGGADAFISAYDASGRHAWTRQLGTSSDDISVGVSADKQGDVYIAGRTYGSLGGIHAGDWDTFVAKWVDLAVQADFDGDGDVDGDDFIRWQIGYGNFPSGGAQKSDGDYDNDGDVDGDDLLGWQREFPSPGSGSASAAVPELATLSLLLVVLVGALPIARRQ